MKPTRAAGPLLATLLFSLTPLLSQAHGDGDHDDEPKTKKPVAAAAAPSDKPSRQPDGSVHLPTATQTQLGIRSEVAELKSLPRSVSLNGRVLMDPNAGGKVQALFAGRIEAGPRGLPALGQTVRKGETLAWVRASLSPSEKASLSATLAELRSQEALAQNKLARLQQLEGSVPQREIEAARLELDGLRQRLKAQAQAPQGGEPLLAPVSGVIAARHVVAGQVVDAKEALFEIVDPARLIVEADAFDAALAGQVGGAHALFGSGDSASSLPLRFVGAGLSLREGALPLQFRTSAQPSQNATPLALGQTLKVLVQTRQKLDGIAVPQAAVVKSPSNLDMVWVQSGPQRFEPRPVRWAPLDGARVSVQEGLKAGERVVVQGASLLRQVR
ncbi:efflux RND transporter periplasmic adaptor subunit [Paucibacter sp. Y2R2-4]|uniref:efflux RND transporter periplasmic adaptor subunit n=1 Tax=Paucibacter sp. Y2R2-4 TaxID=2893553 RepID=UPI0021E385BC|nr:efflux RND transporter periplasmic adaptor subunit [Paucibacter sp. Y2R2-4]MCV2350392.1 efflux RND transporter periplasmic adaptor subunit [Paucibacter sp. Y2R2-4]